MSRKYSVDPDLTRKIVEFYGEPYDDRCSCAFDHVSLRQAAEKFGISVFKVRKILISAGRYTIKQSREVDALFNEGRSIEEIMRATGLSRSSVISYLPY